MDWRPPALPHRLQCSTIGRPGLNRRVRHGNGCFPRPYRRQILPLSPRSRAIDNSTVKHPSPLLPSSSKKGGDPAAPSDTATLLRLHPSHSPHLRQLPPLRVGPLTSGVADSHGVTGGVYKTRERIHRDMLIRDY